MTESRREPSPSAFHSAQRNRWPYAIAGAVIVIAAAMIAFIQVGRGSSSDAVIPNGGLAVGAAVPTDPLPSSGGNAASLADFHGYKVVVYFYEEGT
jgi:hypothetical protein